MPSTASKPPSGAASTPVTRTSSRCGTGPVAASATTAGAAGGWTTTTGSPPPSSDAHPLGHPTADLGAHNDGRRTLVNALGTGLVSGDQRNSTLDRVRSDREVRC